MKNNGLPIFENDSLQTRTTKIGAIFTAVFWLIFLICSFVIKPQPKKPKYKEVQIVLSSTPVVKKEAEAPAPAEAAPTTTAPAEKTPEPVKETVKEPAKAEVKKTEPAKPAVKKPEPAKTAPKSAAKKPEPAKTAPKTAPASAPAKTQPAVEPVEYAVDPMEAFNQQVAKKHKQISNDKFDSLFDADPVEPSPSSSQSQTVKPVENSFSGSAGTVGDTSTNTRQTSTSEESKNEEKASSSTTGKLGKIENTTFKGVAVGGVQAETNVKAKASGSGKTMMEMTDGTQRALLDPSEPIINLSEKAASTIDGSKTVTINFKVVESGNVPRGEISITPASALSEIVRNEIYDQISKWRFESAEFVSTAKFEYKIIKK